MAGLRTSHIREWSRGTAPKGLVQFHLLQVGARSDPCPHDRAIVVGLEPVAINVHPVV